MHDDFQTILDSLPPKPPRSRLEQYNQLIHEMRQRGRTYREIAAVLGEKCQLRVAASTVHYFVRVHRQAKGKGKRALPAQAAPSAIGTAEATARKVVEADREKHTENVSAVRQRISALKKRQAPTEASAPTFHFEPNEPLRLKQGQGKA
jgi:hypothetical protein